MKIQVMNPNQRRENSIIGLRNIAVKIIKAEKENPHVQYKLTEIFKAIFKLFEHRKGDVSKEELVDLAKKESKNLKLPKNKYNWNEILDLKRKAVQNVKQQNSETLDNTKEVQKQKSNGNPYPDNFYLGQAISDGSCFFDSFRQGLEQQKGIKVTVKQLRKDCKEFAQKNPPQWFVQNIGNDLKESGNSFVNRGITSSQYAHVVKNNDFWGRPDIEGRILCEKYGVKLHIIESNPLRAVDNQQDPFLHQLIDNSGSRSAGEHNKVNYNGDDNVLHIINKGGLHFEPLLDRNKDLAKQVQDDLKLAERLQQEENDHQLAKEVQVDEILEYFNMPKDSPLRKEIHKTFGELLVKNPNKEIGDVLKQYINDVTQSIRRSENQSPLNLPNCSMQEVRLTPHQQQTTQFVK